jgi:hypothetical protein
MNPTVYRSGIPVHGLWLIILASFTVGCGPEQVTLAPHNLTQMTPENAPLQRVGKSGWTIVDPSGQMTGQTQVFDYDWIAWNFPRMVAIKADNGDLILLDTGFIGGVPALAFPQIIAAKEKLVLPSDWSEPDDCASGNPTWSA